MFLFDTYWTEAFRALLPWAKPLFMAITELGSDYFYVALVASGYWVLDKRSSVMTALLLVFSSATNYWLKVIIRNPRPPPTNWLPGADPTNYSLPSGHAQTSATIWGWLSLKNRDAWKRALFAALILLIGLSRVYIGVHWLGDVILGWAVGAVILSLAWKIERSASPFLTKYDPNLLLLGIAVFGLASTILTELTSQVNIVGLEDNFGAIGGLMMGLGVGLMLERRYVDFKVSPEGGERWRMVLRVVLGLGLVLLVMLGLSPILPTSIYWLRVIRYALSAIVALFVWPLLFTKIGI